MYLKEIQQDKGSPITSLC